MRLVRRGATARDDAEQLAKAAHMAFWVALELAEKPITDVSETTHAPYDRPPTEPTPSPACPALALDQCGSANPASETLHGEHSSPRCRQPTGRLGPGRFSWTVRRDRVGRDH